ncbi:MAG: hypothetical protein DMG24_18940 [Acidobacteria bacterium]|nr:MAG: hypothetical protein DMG24_18940 [Acidobacteriota bacterium]
MEARERQALHSGRQADGLRARRSALGLGGGFVFGLQARDLTLTTSILQSPFSSRPLSTVNCVRAPLRKGQAG